MKSAHFPLGSASDPVPPGFIPAALCALAVAAVPLFHYTAGFTAIAQALALLAVLAAASTLLLRSPSIHPAMLALLALAGFWGLTVLGYPEVWISYLSLLKICLLALAAHLAIRTRPQLLMLLGCYSATGLILLAMNWGALAGFNQTLSAPAAAGADEPRFAGTLSNPNVAGMHGVMVLLTGFIVFFNSRTSLRWPVLLSGISGGLALAYYSGSRKAMLGLALLPLILPWLARWRNDRLRTSGTGAAGLALGALLVSGLLLLHSPHLDRLVATVTLGTQVEASSSERMGMVRRAVELWSEHPLFGCGFAGFARLSGFEGYSHTTIGEVLCNGGLIGLALAGYFYLVPPLQLARMTHRSARPGEPGLCAGLLAFWGLFSLFSVFAVMLDPGEYLPLCGAACGYLQEKRVRDQDAGTT